MGPGATQVEKEQGRQKKGEVKGVGRKKEEFGRDSSVPRQR